MGCRQPPYLLWRLKKQDVRVLEACFRQEMVEVLRTVYGPTMMTNHLTDRDAYPTAE